MRARVLLAIAVLALTAAAAIAWAGTSSEPGDAPERLPDLDQVAPYSLEVTRDRAGGGYRLGFGSAVDNLGAGALIVSGRRPRGSTPNMTADQLVERAGAPFAVVEGVGKLRYVRSPDHAHWHLLGFERYELRRPGDDAALVTDRKTGFCLGDRYAVRRARDLPRRPPDPVYTRRCGLGDTARLGLIQGISVGYGDEYEPNLEGQSLSLKGVEDGRYVLVHRVNVDRALRESDYTNNASSLLLSLRRRNGRPAVRVLNRCPSGAVPNRC
jgi:Lysyl oxidase